MMVTVIFIHRCILWKIFIINPQEIQHMVSKTIDYEMYNFQDPSFLTDAVMISGVDAAMAPLKMDKLVAIHTTQTV